MRTSRSLLALVAGTLFLTACGGAASEPESAPSPTEVGGTETAAFPVDVAGVTIDAEPTAIISLSATATEILFAIGAGSQVLAVDSTSDFPAEAPTTELSAFEPNVEAIAELDPDLVIASYDPGDLVAGLGELGIPVLIQGTATSLSDSYEQMEQLGAATGRLAEAVALVSSLQIDIDQIVASVPQRDDPITYYYELDPTYYSLTDETFIGELLAMVGMTSIAVDPDGTSYGFPQMNAEAIVEADPAVILLADSECCQVTPESVAERAGWGEMTAIRDGNVIVLDEDIASRWGPRVVDLLRTVADLVRDLEPANA